MFYIADLPVETKTKDIQQGFKMFCDVSIRWKDSRSCFVILRDATKAVLVQEAFRLGVYRGLDGGEGLVVETGLKIETWVEYKDRVLSVNGDGGKRKRTED